MDNGSSAVMDPPVQEPTSTEPGEDDGLGPVGSDPGSVVDPLTQTGEDPPAEPPTPAAELPAEEEDEDPEPENQLFLLGNKELGLKVSGRKPDSSSLKIKGGKIDLSGQYNREDRITAVVQLQVTSDNDQDTIETATGLVKSTKKTQMATICGIDTIADWLALKLEGHPELIAQVKKAAGLDEE